MSDSLRRESVLRVLSDINVSRELGPSTFVYNIGGDLSISDDRGILLAGADRCAVSCQVLLNWEVLVKAAKRFAETIPLKPTLAGESERPCAFKITPWACVKANKDAKERTDENEGILKNLTIEQHRAGKGRIRHRKLKKGNELRIELIRRIVDDEENIS